jgi:hypothetical protein
VVQLIQKAVADGANMIQQQGEAGPDKTTTDARDTTYSAKGYV